jgi:signal transduction histidine kinase
MIDGPMSHDSQDGRDARPQFVTASMPGLPSRARRELDAIMDIARTVNSSMSIDELLPSVMERTTRLMDADRSTLFVVDAERGELWSKVIQGARPHEIRLKVGEGIAGWVAEQGRTVNLVDVYDDPRFDQTWDKKSGYRTRSLLCVPVLNKEGEVVAVVQCLNKQHRPFDQEDELLLSCIGGQCAVAIENAFLYASLLERNRALLEAEAQLTRKNAELEVLYEVEQSLASAGDLPTLISVALQRVQILLHVEAASLLLVSETGGQIHALHGDASVATTHAVDTRTAQTLLLHSRFPIRRLPDAGGGVADVLLPEGTRVAVKETYAAPLTDGRVQTGVLQVINRIERPGGDGHSPEDLLRVLSLVASQLARGVTSRIEREAGERAERLSLLGHSLSAILHDMRTPLTAVSGYVELMADEESVDTRRDYSARISRALEHMEGMTHEVLSFARGQREVLVAKVYLDKFIAEVREMLEPEVESFGVSLQVETKYDGTARFDASKLKRVILNLARNACQAMGQGGTFRWTIDRTGESLVFECADTGPGIPKEMEGRLFESFATHGKTGGTGLGLAMAKKIVDAHCGRISASSVPGSGATFRLELPL